MKTYVIGDIHGNIEALRQVLTKSKFDYDNDMLITLGDIVDGHPNSFDCVEELLKIKHRIDLRGNHDETFNNWLQGRGHSFFWAQGGLVTAESYAKGIGIVLHKEVFHELNIFGKTEERYNISLHPTAVPQSHHDFFRKQIDYYIDDKNRAFVHAGYTDKRGLGFDDRNTYLWSRKLWQNNAMIPSQEQPKLLRPHDTIFIGHTTTESWNTTEPMFRYNVINLDTGAGYAGKLTIMNVETKEYWQSENKQEKTCTV